MPCPIPTPVFRVGTAAESGREFREPDARAAGSAGGTPAGTPVAFQDAPAGAPRAFQGAPAAPLGKTVSCAPGLHACMLLQGSFDWLFLFHISLIQLHTSTSVKR